MRPFERTAHGTLAPMWKKVWTLLHTDPRWTVRYIVKRAPMHLGFRLARIVGRSSYIARIAGVDLIFTFDTPYHYLIARLTARNDTETHLLNGWKEASLRARTIYDIGGFNGMYGLLAAKANPHADIVVFEPDAVNASHIERNIKANGLANCRLIRAAVGDTNGVIRFSQGGTTGEHISSAGVEVPVNTLDSLPPADLIKMDIEGAELRALKGLSYRPDILLVEVHPKGLREMGDSEEEFWREVHRRKYRSWLLDSDVGGKTHHLLF